MATTTANVSDGMTGDNFLHSGIHPLLIDHVAQKIFANLDWSYSNSNILYCRQVCKTWNTVITKGMKRKGKVRKLTFGYQDTNRMENFLNAMRCSIDLPFDIFQFDANFFIERNAEIFKKFLVNWGPDIKNLSLTFGKHYSMNLVEISKSFELTRWSNLQRLSIHCAHLYTMEDSSSTLNDSYFWKPKHVRTQCEGLLFLLEAILLSAEKLEEFDLYLPSRHFGGSDRKFANENFGNLIATVLPETVTSLKLTMEIQNNHLQNLQRLKLKRLYLNYYGSQLSSNLIADYLNSQASNLADLEVIDYESKTDFQLSPEFPKVKRLKLKETHDASFNVLYLTKFPNVKEFVLVNGSGRRNLEIPTEISRSLDNFQHLAISDFELTYPIENSNVVKKVANYFPNLTAFRVQVGPSPESKQAIEAVFQFMSKLTELQIVFPYLCNSQPIDHILTGIPFGYCQRIIKEELFDSSPGSVPFFGEFTRRPSLGKLKDLQKLILQAEPSSLFITDVTAYFGLCCAPSLDEVVLGLSHNISSKAMLLLKSRFKVTEINTRTHPNSRSIIRSDALVPVSFHEPVVSVSS